MLTDKEKETQVELGARIRKERSAKRLTIRKFARKANIFPSQVKNIEDGRVGMSLITASRIANALKIVIKLP